MSKANTILYDRWGDLRIGWVFAIFLSLVSFLIAAVLVISFALAAKGCGETRQALNLDGTWGVWTGCIVTVDGNPIPLDRYFVNQEAGK